MTIETGGGHTNAVLSDRPSPSSAGRNSGSAFAKTKGAELRAVVPASTAATSTAPPGFAPANTNWPVFQAQDHRGRTVRRHAQLHNALPSEWNLDVKRDVTLIETASSATIAVVKASRRRSARRPSLTSQGSGIRSGANRSSMSKGSDRTPIHVQRRLDTIQQDPELVRAFVRGMIKGLKFLYANRDEAAEIAKKQFPTMPLDDLKATLDRSFADELWSRDGVISREAWATASAVVRSADILKTDVKYDEIIDMSFVDSIRSSL